MEETLKKKVAGGLINGKGENENVQTERNIVKDNLIVRGNQQTKRGPGSRRNTEGKRIENNLFSAEDFFNMN